MDNSVIGMAVCATVSVVAAAVCAGLSVLLTVTAAPLTLPPPGRLPESNYEGKAYLYQDGRRFSEVPYFQIYTNRKDQDILYEHVKDLATVRHWVTESDQYYQLRFVMPDYDVAIVKRMSQDPRGWAETFAGRPQFPEQYAPLPPGDSLMAVDVDLDIYPMSGWRTAGITGAAFTGLVALLTLVGALGLFVDFLSSRDRSKPA